MIPSTACQAVSPCVLRSWYMNNCGVIKALSQDPDIFSITCVCWPFCKLKNHLHQLGTVHCNEIIIDCSYFTKVQMKASSSACNGERLALVFLVPIKPSKPSKVLYHLCHEKISWAFHEPSVKHHRP